MALATDSAVTIGQGSNAKTYLSENKIFELSERKPVGLMIYNSLDFYGYPWEVLIKDFRREHSDAKCSQVCDWAQLFIDWLQHDDRRPPLEQQKAHFLRHIEEILKAVKNQAFQEIIPLVGGGAAGPPTAEQQRASREVLTRILRDQIRALLNLKSISDFNKLTAARENPPTPLDETMLESWVSSNWDEILAVADKVFSSYELDSDEKNLIRQFIYELFCRQHPTNGATGLVFAGFGDKDKFPSLHHIVVDGVLADRLRCMEHEYYDVDRGPNKGMIYAFAQSDVAHRFLYGLDDDLEEEIVTYFSDSIQNLSKPVTEAFNLSDDDQKKVQGVLSNAADTLTQRYFRETSNRLRNRFFSSIVGMVRLMPKQEMANLAESLVNITIIKRRASAELDTVGGPIDVAVISRHEGFVWVKRKHYFDPQYNARFFWRQFGGTPPFSNGAKT